jgi:UV DNA damage endonuclease
MENPNHAIALPQRRRSARVQAFATAATATVENLATAELEDTNGLMNSSVKGKRKRSEARTGSTQANGSVTKVAVESQSVVISSPGKGLEDGESELSALSDEDLSRGKRRKTTKTKNNKKKSTKSRKPVQDEDIVAPVEDDGEFQETKKKAKKPRKPRAPKPEPVYIIPDVVKKETKFRGRLGTSVPF